MAISKYSREYWKNRLGKRKRKLPDGSSRDSLEYAVQIQFNGQRKWFNAYTSNRDIAIDRVMKFYEILRGRGNWEEAKNAIFPGKVHKKINVSVGDYIESAMKTCTKNNRTLQIYIQKFRTLVADICNISRPREASYARGTAYLEWLDRVHRVKLEQITVQKVQIWKKQRMERGSSTPIQEASTRRTINSILRNVKSLFAEQIRRNIGLLLPVPLFVDGIELESVRTLPYFSKIPNFNKFLRAAREKLYCHPPGSIEHEGYKIILLALLAGLRRDEIDTLSWAQIDLSHGKIHICTNEFTGAKTYGSERMVDISEAFSKTFKCFQEEFPEDRFVVHNSVQPNTTLKTQHHYRCYRIFRFVSKWLNENGINDEKPLHALRKEYGSELAKNHGIYAASISLGHSDIRITRSTYVAKKDRYLLDYDLE
jgi:integrase